MNMLKMNYYVSIATIGLFVIIITIHHSHAVSCTNKQTVGSGDIDAASVNSPDLQDANITILMANIMGTIQCCGTVSKWEMILEGEGFVTVQVWRPITGATNKYILLGKKVIKHKSMGISKESKSIANKNLIPVQPGDVIGFVQKDPSTLRYTTCDPALPSDPDTCADDLLVLSDKRDTSVGDVVEFVTQQSAYLGKSTVRGYALKAYLDTKSQATCTDRHRSISDTMEVGEHVITVHVDAFDIHDADSTISFASINQSLPLAIHPKTGQITVSGVLNPEYPSTKYKLTVEVYDACTTTTSTCSVTITVTNDPKPVTFISLPSSEELSSFDTGHVKDFSISQQRDEDEVNCYIHSIFPDHASFYIKNNSKTDYGVYLTEAPPLSDMLQKNTFIIVLVIACENSEGYYNQSTLTLTYDLDKKRVAALMVVISVILTLVILAIVTVLLAWLCHAGKIKVWPSNNGSTGNKMNTLNNKTLNQTAKQNHVNNGNHDSHSPDANHWDNFNSFYKIDRNVTSMESPFYAGFQNGDPVNQYPRINRSTIIQHSHQHSFGNNVNDFYSPEEIPFPRQVFRKKPWKP